MKSELNATDTIRRNISIEIPSIEVDKTIERVTKKKSRSTQLPGFRPGKAPAHLIQQRMLDTILREVAEELVPSAVEQALKEHAVVPVDRPNITDLNIAKGQSLKFVANFEVLPEINLGEYRGLNLRPTPIEVTEDHVTEAIQQLRERAATLETVEDRSSATGDILTVDLARKPVKSVPPDLKEKTNSEQTDIHSDIQIEIGNAGNPAGLDDHLIGLDTGSAIKFILNQNNEIPIETDDHKASDQPVAAINKIDYAVTIKKIQRKIVPNLDDDFASSVGSIDTLDALRDQVRENLCIQAEQETNRTTRDELLKKLAAQLNIVIPEALINREIDRRTEHFANRLVSQQIDPRKANVNWDEFRVNQREAATDTVKSSLVLDEIAKIENIETSEEDLNKEIERLATLNNRTVSAMRAIIEKEGDPEVLSIGLRREKAIDFVLQHATIVEA
ncbi:MAG: trigger factor [Rhodospirillaceae bacterium]|nr:trigger factor [Rhodospirillaceae bacterium]|tara:strand:+ start:14966 stop:16306 length:1341 start_codon:yes stop_codon:yes gene_type:complete